MYRLRLQAVDSRLATQEELDAAGIDQSQIPTDENGNHWRILAHQAATVKTLRYGSAPIVINRAMTGDGKTMAGRFQLLSEKWRSFAMYPTNELAHDQAQGFDALLHDWTPPGWGIIPDTVLISAQRIDELEGLQDFSRLERLEILLQSDYVMTNPDIFHYIMNFAYTQYGTAHDLLPAMLAAWYRLFIFDEFHLFGVEQTGSVMIAMCLLKQIARQDKPPRFLFLSATPQKLLTHLAGQLGIEVELIEGSYQHGHIQPAGGYRRILRETDLHLYSGRIEEWVKEHFEDTIKPFFLDHQPAAKGLLIANSVAAAHRIHAHLRPLCENAGVKIAINTGITPKEDRGREFDLLVATSTVDVGVDFKINFLVFESRDAASHLQRLGRLGRHDTDTNGHSFQAYEAHALLPQWTLEGLAKTFAEDEVVSREDYKTVLEKNYSPLQQFDPYIGRWAGVQAAKVLHELSNKYIRTQYRELRETLKTEFQALFGRSVKKYVALVHEKQIKTIEAAAAFRGGSVFNCLVQDPETNSKRIMSYNLIPLLLNADVQAIPIQDMLENARRQGQDSSALEKTRPLAAYRLLGWRDEPRKITIELDAELPAERHETVIEQNRFRIFCPSMSELQSLNRYLYERLLVAFIIPNKEPDLVRRLLRLGYQLELFNFTARGGLKGTVVFGRDALLIDSVLFRHKADDACLW